MPLQLALIKTDSAQADPKPRQNSPGDTGDPLRNHPSAPTPVQDETMAARAPDVHSDPALAVVVAAWPTLSEDTRATIVRLIQGEEVRA
jgi:hypothetical protein